MEIKVEVWKKVISVSNTKDEKKREKRKNKKKREKIFYIKNKKKRKREGVILTNSLHLAMQKKK